MRKTAVALSFSPQRESLLEDSIFPGDYIVEDDTFTLQYQANF